MSRVICRLMIVVLTKPGYFIHPIMSLRVISKGMEKSLVLSMRRSSEEVFFNYRYDDPKLNFLYPVQKNGISNTFLSILFTNCKTAPCWISHEKIFQWFFPYLHQGIEQRRLISLKPGFFSCIWYFVWRLTF